MNLKKSRSSIVNRLLTKASLYLCVCGAIYSCSPENKITKIDFVQHHDTLRVLKNPGKGWYHHLLDNGVDKYAISSDSIFYTFPGMDHLYLRLAWSYLEPEEGKFDWSRIDEVVNKYVPLGYKIAFRISAKETGSYPGSVGQADNGVQFATPVWVMKAGAKGIITEAWNTKSWTPDWDDPVYLAKLEAFQTAFAARYDGKAWVSYIDVGSIGEWGEGHTSFSTKIPPTVAEVKANIDVYLRTFKHTQLVCTDDLLYHGKTKDETDSLYKYAVSNGITLRDDSPLVDWYTEQNRDTWSVSHPHFYDSLYLHKPIVFELQHYGMVKDDGNWLGKNGEAKVEKMGYSGAHFMRKAIEIMHASYIGYHGYAEEWLAENPDLTNELANRCGYWIFPVSAQLPDNFFPGVNQISIVWQNKGVAPPYSDFILNFLFTGTDGKTYDVKTNAGSTNWLPGKTVSNTYEIQLPADFKRDKYKVTLKLTTPDENNVAIDLGLKSEIMNLDKSINLN